MPDTPRWLGGCDPGSELPTVIWHRRDGFNLASSERSATGDGTTVATRYRHPREFARPQHGKQQPSNLENLSGYSMDKNTCVAYQPANSYTSSKLHSFAKRQHCQSLIGERLRFFMSSSRTYPLNVDFGSDLVQRPISGQIQVELLSLQLMMVLERPPYQRDEVSRRTYCFR